MNTETNTNLIQNMLDSQAVKSFRESWYDLPGVIDSGVRVSVGIQPYTTRTKESVLILAGKTAQESSLLSPMQLMAQGDDAELFCYGFAIRFMVTGESRIGWLNRTIESYSAGTKRVIYMAYENDSNPVLVDMDEHGNAILPANDYQNTSESVKLVKMFNIEIARVINRYIADYGTGKINGKTISQPVRKIEESDSDYELRMLKFQTRLNEFLNNRMLLTNTDIATSYNSMVKGINSLRREIDDPKTPSTRLPELQTLILQAESAIRDFLHIKYANLPVKFA